MSDDRKRPLWPWIVVLLFGLPVLYVLSMWPLLWLWSRDMIPNWSHPAIPAYIIPMNYVLTRAPKPAQEAIVGYIKARFARKMRK